MDRGPGPPNPVSTGDYSTIIGVIGDTSKLDEGLVSGLDIVEGVKRVSEPFKSANRKFHPLDSIIQVGQEHVKVGHGNFVMIAGPCSVESEEQIISVAKSVKAAGATMLRGGAFKPRTSPYDFQGLKADGIELLLEAKRETGLPIVTEIMNANTAVVRGRGRDSGWCSEYAEFRATQGTGKDPEADPHQTRSGQYHQGATDERRIYYG